jgi:hypothetical protein
MAADRVFRRGSHVIEYWLAHAEGFEVSSRASHLGVVEDVRLERADGHARELVIRTPVLHRRRRLAADAFAAVDPARRRLELVPPVVREPTWPDRVVPVANELAVLLAHHVRRLAVLLQHAAQRGYRELAHGYARVARRAAEMWRQYHRVERE